MSAAAIEIEIRAAEAMAAHTHPDNQAERDAFLVWMLKELLRAYCGADCSLSDHTRLRRAGFSTEEIALGMQDVVRT